MEPLRIKRALISVSDKTGLTEFAQQLVASNVELFSTGGTRRHLESGGIPVQDVSAYTGFPEMMDGRLKTLHPKIFGGILCRQDRTDDLQAIAQHDIQPFELIVVNLYPFESTVAQPAVTWGDAIEQIDIGGPSMVRAAAKNHAFVTIVTNSSQYSLVTEAIAKSGATSVELRRHLAAQAFARTAAYDQAISGFFAKELDEAELFPARLDRSYGKIKSLRYGENPHQKAALYVDPSVSRTHLVRAKVLNGKELSYNNFLDLDSALRLVRMLPDFATAVIKHNNPCGAASANNLAEATQKAMDGDPQSAFGSVLAMNQVLDVATAEVLSIPGLFVEAIIAPGYQDAAVEILTSKPKWKTNVRLLDTGALGDLPEIPEVRQIDGGVLVQDADLQEDSYDRWQIVTEKRPTEDQMAELRFAWMVVRHIKSNAIAVTSGRSLVGAGAGQMSRIDAVEIALHKASERADGAALASDAFFPFADSIRRAVKSGISTIIQPGGSRRDQEVIDVCNESGLPMIFTGQRHFKH